MYLDIETYREILAILHDPKHFDLKRTVSMDALLGLFNAIFAANAVGEMLDEIRHPEFHDVDVGEPIYIVAAPRSGTTFFHRLMSLDPRFSTFTLFQTIFPSISASELIEVARRFGPFARVTGMMQNAIDERGFGGWEGVHDTGLGSDEEDEAIWAMAMATPAVLLLFPYADRFQHLRFVDRMPESEKTKMVKHYRAALQRRIFRHPGKTLLMKNVLLPGRYEIVTRAAPKSRFVHLIRHPYEVLPSTLSMFTMPWEYVAPEHHGATRSTKDFADLMIDYYRFFYEREIESKARGDGRFISIRYRELVADPMSHLARVYTQFELPWTRNLEATFRAELDRQSEFRSGHAYSLEQFGLTREYVAEKLGDVMDYYGFER